MTVSLGIIQGALTLIIIIAGKLIFSAIESNRERIEKSNDDLRREINELRAYIHELADRQRDIGRELYQADGKIREDIAVIRTTLKHCKRKIR